MALNKKDLQEAKKLVDQINKAYKEMGKGITFPMPDAKSTLQDFIAIQNVLRETEATQKRIADEVEREAKAIKEAADAQRDLEEEAKELFGAIAATVDEMNKFKSGQQMAVKSAKNLQGISKDFLDIQQGITEASTEDLSKLAIKALKEKENLIVAQDLLTKKSQQRDLSAQELATLNNINNGLLNSDGLHAKILEKIKKQQEESAKVDKQMGNLGAGVEGVKGGLDKIGMGALGKAMGLDDALKKTRAQVKAGEAGTSQLSAQAALAKNVGKNLKDGLGPLVIALAALQQLVKAFKAIDKASGEIAKTQGISAAEGRELVAVANQQALATGDVLVNTLDIVKAQQALNNVMGTSVQFPAKMAVDMNTMSEKLGLSAEAQNFFAKNAIKSGGDIEKQLQDISDITTQLNQQNGISLNQKSIQEGISKLSASQRVNAKGSAKEMANQVYQSKLLGLSAQDLEGVQNSLLDFESSIAAEMEAELMTGKQLNLEGARAAALAGDQAALAAEIRKEVGTAAEFADMDVLSRQSLAKAFGLNINQMAEMLEKQKVLEQIKKGGFESQSKAQEAYNKRVDAGMSHEEALSDMKLSGIDDALASQMKSASQSDKINAMTERLTDLFMGLAGPLMTMLDPFLTVLTEITNLVSFVLAPVFEGIKATVDGIKGIFSGTVGELSKMETIMGSIAIVAGTFYATAKGIKAVQTALNFLKGSENKLSLKGMAISARQKAMDMGSAAINVVRGAYQSLGVIPVVGAALAAVAAIAGIAYLSTKAKKTKDLSIDPNGGPVVSSMQEGTLFQGSKNDGVSMGPGEGLSGRSGGGGGGSMVETNKLLRQLIAAVNSGGDVFLDGNKVGQSLALVTSNMGN